MSTATRLPAVGHRWSTIFEPFGRCSKIVIRSKEYPRGCYVHQSRQVRRVRQLYVCVPDGGDLHRSHDQARQGQPSRVRRVLRLLHGAQPGAPESDDRAHDAQDLPDAAPALRSRAGCVPDGGLRAGGAHLAARGAAGLLGPARAPRVDRRRRARHRGSEDQRHQRPREVRARPGSRSSSAGLASASGCARFS